MMEIELKLELSEADTDALQACSDLSAQPAIAALDAIYFDTPDRALAKAGYSLRIRSSDGRFIQTIKAGNGGAGLHARSEWEQEVDDARAIALEGTPLAKQLGEHAAELAPAFEIKVERRTWLVRHEHSEIEVVLDRGAAVTASGERQSKICEVELELTAGSSSALFTLARKLDAITPLRLGVLTKAERGYALGEPDRQVVKAEPVRLANDVTAAEAFQQIAQSCIRHFRLNEDLVLASRAAEPLHQARVALRRLRSAFSLYRPVLGGHAEVDQLRGELRWLAGELGQARDLDVLLAGLGPGPLINRARTAREAAYDAVETVLGSDRERALLLNLVEWLHEGAWLREGGTQAVREQPAPEFAAAALDRFRRKVRRRGKNLREIDDEARHELRKDAKKLRYAAEFFEHLFDSKQQRRRRKAFLKALQALQDELGALNDIATAPLVLRELAGDDAISPEELHGVEEKRALIEAAAIAHGQFSAAKRFWRQ